MRRRSGRARKHRQIPQAGRRARGRRRPGRRSRAPRAGRGRAPRGRASSGSPSTRRRRDRARASDRAPRPIARSAHHARWLARTTPTSRDACAAVGRPVSPTPCARSAGCKAAREALVEGARVPGLDARGPGRRDAAARALRRRHAPRPRRAPAAADLGEVRGFAYYTGTIFHAYAPGTGDALVSGGRYDELLARFGMRHAGGGVRLDLDRAARGAAGSARRPRSTARASSSSGGPGDARLTALRGRGTAAVAIADRAAALRWARSWGFTHVLDGSSWIDPITGTATAPPGAAGEAATRGGYTEERGQT